MNEESPKYSLNKQDLMKIGKGALMALGGVLVTYLLQVIPNVDFGQYTPVVVGIASVGLNALSKYFAGK